MNTSQKGINKGLVIFFGVFFISLSVVFVISIYTFSGIQNMIKTNVAESTGQTIEQTASHVSMFLDGFNKLTDQIRLSQMLIIEVDRMNDQRLPLSLRNKARDDGQKILNSFRDGDSQTISSIALIPKVNYRDFYFSGSDETLMMRSYPGPNMKFDDLSSSKFEQIIHANGSIVWFPTEERGFFGFGSMPTFTIGRVVTNLKQPDQEMVLLMEIKQTALDEILSSVELGDDAGTIILDPNHKRIAGNVAGLEKITKLLDSNQSFTYETDAEDNEWLELKSTIDKSTWNLYAYFPTDKLFEKSNQMFYMLLSSLVFLALVVILAAVLSRRFVKMYRQSQRFFEEIEQKNIELSLMDKLKDQFLANTSHELRTPLNGIIGLSESLIDGAAGDMNKIAKYNLGMVVASGRRLMNLINDILDFSKIKEKEIQLNQQPLKLNEVVDLVITMFIPLANQKQITLSSSVDVELPAVHADANRLQQILYNLLGNALKFTEEGQVVISARVLYGDQLLISVTDSGVGIPFELHERIFMSFEQGQGDETRKHGGTGLGLSVTKMLVELHQGSIQVQSIVGQGSTFSFTLPTTSEKAVQLTNIGGIAQVTQKPTTEQQDDTIHSDKDVEEFSKLKGAKILIVDDEPVNLLVLENHLSMLNFEIIKASSGMEAMNLIQNKLKPDILLLDVMMPQMSGFDVCEKVREIYHSSELPIILLTAKNQVNDLVQGFDVGANDYLVKPFTKPELLARLKLHLRLANWNQQLEDAVQERTVQIKSLMNHSDQGFLSFDKTLKVDSEYSSVCRDIFEQEIVDVEIDKLVYSMKSDEQTLFKQILQEWFVTPNRTTRELMLELLPKEVNIRGKQIIFEVKELVKSEHHPLSIMMILTDVTEKTKLSQQIKSEQDLQRMIVNVVTRKMECIDLLKTFRDFTKQLRVELTFGDAIHPLTFDDVMRALHTFKGNFSQLSFSTLPKALHDLEEQFMGFNDELEKDQWKVHFLKNDLYDLAKIDIDKISEILGTTFLYQEDTLAVDPNLIRNLEKMVINKFKSSEQLEMLTELRKLYYVPLNQLLMTHTQTIETLAMKMNKSIKPLKVYGEMILVDPSDFKDFNKSIVHLFRNAVDHGIETFESRIMEGKEMFGTISCHLTRTDFDIHLVIEDNGSGIDPEMIRLKVFQKGLNSMEEMKKMHDDKVIQYVFHSNFSTRDKVTEISGRGYGLDAFKHEVEQMNGEIYVRSKVGEGTKFHITIPYMKRINEAGILKTISNQIVNNM